MKRGPSRVVSETFQVAVYDALVTTRPPPTHTDWEPVGYFATSAPFDQLDVYGELNPEGVMYDMYAYQ